MNSDLLYFFDKLLRNIDFDVMTEFGLYTNYVLQHSFGETLFAFHPTSLQMA